LRGSKIPCRLCVLFSVQRHTVPIIPVRLPRNKAGAAGLEDTACYLDLIININQLVLGWS
jgi:hypothetical protein